MELLAPESTEADEVTNWPPIRLAVVSDSAPSTAAENPVESDTASWSRTDTPYWNDAALPGAGIDEVPVLIVEDDNPAPKSPVRREEYRNLFSRLRSG